MSTHAWTRTGIGVTLAILFGAGCGLERKPRPAEFPDGAVAILDPVPITPGGRISLRWLNELFPRAPRLSAMADPAEALAGLGADQVLIIPNVSHLPVHWWKPLQNHLVRGHPVLFWGTRPLEVRVRVENGRAKANNEVISALLSRARAAGPLSDIRTWRHENNSGRLKGAVKLIQPKNVPWPAVLVEVEALDEWDALVLDPVPPKAVSRGENSLAFFARGDAETSRLVVQCEDRDGARWLWIAEVDAEWRPHLVHQSLFQRVGSEPGRDAPAGGFQLERLKRVSIGLDSIVAPQRPGAHQFGLSEVRVVADPRPPDEAAGWPDIALLSPPHRRYELGPGWLFDPVASEPMGSLPGQSESPYPLPRGLDPSPAPVGRWVPLFGLMDSQREIRGWPASLFILPGDPRPTGRWGWIGLDPLPAARPLTEQMLVTAVRRLRENLFFQFAGCDRWVFPPGAELRAAVQWRGDPSRAPALRISAELRRAEDRYVLRRIMRPADAPGRPIEVHLGVMPSDTNATEDHVVCFKLEDAHQQERVYDVIEQAIKIATSVDQPAVRTAGASFHHAGFTFFPVGVRYAFRPDPDAIRRDLDRLKKMGMNTLFLEYRDEFEAPQLRYLLAEARRLNLLVIAAVAGLDPLAPDWERARRLLETVDLPRNLRVFALDLGLSPDLGNRERRRSLDPDWKNWLVEQYGSVAAAESVLGDLWKEHGEPIAPPDDALRPGAPSSALTAAYRRFLADTVSRRIGWLRRRLADAGCRQMLTARYEVHPRAPPPIAGIPIDPAWGSVHLDFISLSLPAWAIGDASHEDAAVFGAVYARGASGGKPVIWHGGGVSVGRHPRSADLLNQLRIFNSLFEIVLRSRSAGCFGWSLEAADPAGEDTGLTQPNGSWRPAGLAFRDFITRIRRERVLPADWRGRELEQGLDAGGLAALWEQWKQPYAGELAAGRLEEVRPAGFGRRAGDLFQADTGVAPAIARDLLNAEWGRIAVDGVERARGPGEPVRAKVRQVLRLELLNTGPATWDAPSRISRGRVRVVLMPSRGSPEFVAVGALPFGGREELSWVVTEAGEWRLRPEAVGIGAFGEVLHVIAEAEPSE